MACNPERWQAIGHFNRIFVRMGRTVPRRSLKSRKELERVREQMIDSFDRMVSREYARWLAANSYLTRE